MPIYELPSSNKILVEEGKVNPKVLLRLIKEAYKIEGLYAECEIQVKRKEDSDSEIGAYFSYVKYKELWDCYRNIFGKEEFHPYDKVHPFPLGWAFVEKMKEANFLTAYCLVGLLTVNSIKFDKKKKSEKESLEKFVA